MTCAALAPSSPYGTGFVVWGFSIDADDVGIPVGFSVDVWLRGTVVV